MAEIRLQKFLSEAGVCSRRKAEEYIAQGRVKINNKIANLGEKVTIGDKVYLDNKEIKQQEEKVYVLLNKPTGYVTTLQDEFDRPKIIDLIPISQRLVPVGRLDMHTSRSNNSYK